MSSQVTGAMPERGIDAVRGKQWPTRRRRLPLIPLGQIVIALVGLWIPALINTSGVKNMGAFQLVTAVLKFLPLIFVGVVGLFFVRAANFGPFNATGSNWLGALSLAGALALFTYSGVDSVSGAAERIRDPARNIGRASLSTACWPARRCTCSARSPSSGPSRTMR